MSSTIIAQATPTGSGAIALLRISGPEALNISDKFLFIKNKKIDDLPTHTVHFAKAKANNITIDHVMVIIMKAPRTFTGENVVEITSHNNQLIIQALIEEAIKNGAKQALPGEFAQQAVLNEKIDIIQAESINELINAQTPQALKISLQQLEGSLSSKVNNISHKILQALALCESNFEFLEDENISFDEQIKKTLEEVLANIKVIKYSFNLQKQIRQGFRVALLGSVNAGKSSLFNALIEEEKAIVTPIAGTTRDVIESTVILDGQAVTFVDTAGLRETDDYVESIGIKRSLEEAIKSDLILLVRDEANPENDIFYKKVEKDFSNKIIFVQTKVDLPNIKILENKVAVSSLNNLGIKELKEIVISRIKDLAKTGASSFLINKRQFHDLTEAEIHINNALKNLNNKNYEIVSIDLNESLQVINQLTGKSIREEAMDLIFRQFCVGK